jgi:hypothetical protein
MKHGLTALLILASGRVDGFGLRRKTASDPCRMTSSPSGVLTSQRQLSNSHVLSAHGNFTSLSVKLGSKITPRSPARRYGREFSGPLR